MCNMMTAEQKLKVIEAFIGKGQDVVEIQICSGFDSLRGLWTLNGLVAGMAKGDVFRIKPVPHKWQNLIDFIKKGDFEGKKGVRFNKTGIEQKELLEFLFANGYKWINGSKEIKVSPHEMGFNENYMGICEFVAEDPSPYLHYNPDTCRFVEPKMVPWTREDVPPVCWLRGLRAGEISANYAMIIDAWNNKVFTRLSEWTFQELLDLKEYSTDLKTWKPCGKESK